MNDHTIADLVDLQLEIEGRYLDAVARNSPSSAAWKEFLEGADRALELVAGHALQSAPDRYTRGPTDLPPDGPKTKGPPP